MDNETKKINNEAYFQVPKSLFKMRRNGEISLTAFDIYILMLDRYKLSKKNKWIDNEGSIYINYSYEELLEDLCIKKKNIISEGLKELESLSLIKRRKRYRNSTVFYLTNESNQKVTLIKNESNQNDDFLKMKVTFSGNESNQKVTLKSEKNSQKDFENKSKNENEKALNKNNISNNNYKSNNNNVIDYINNKNNNIVPALHNEIYLLLEGRDIKINQITKICVDIQRIKEVIAYANNKNYGNGFILKALKENWQLGLESQASCKPGLDIQAGLKKSGLDIQADKNNPLGLESQANGKDYSMSIDEALKRSREKK